MKNRSPKVVVIGAGLSGLTAAFRLKKKGYDVAVYEARNRVGGRILTALIDNDFVELGGQNIVDGGDAKHMLSLIKELSLEIIGNYQEIHDFYLFESNILSIKDLLKKHPFDLKNLQNQLVKLKRSKRNMREVLNTLLDPSNPFYQMIASKLEGFEGNTIDFLSTFYVNRLYNLLTEGISSPKKNIRDYLQSKGAMLY
ncbi:FAD-dependent oxidoreductase [Chlamydiales bacterium]|nr:FAD-dependent oxidoreductase [Chlamydiales bacterium]